MADLDDLLPRERTPRHCRDLAGDPRADQAVLRTPAVSPYPFVRAAVAGNPRAEARTPAAIPLDDLSDYARNGLLRTVAEHENADRALLLDVLARAVRLLNAPGNRPYSPALALAARMELGRDEVLALTRQPNSSSRMNSGVARVPADRELDETDYLLRSPANAAMPRRSIAEMTRD